MTVWVKICGITRAEDAVAAADAGADAIGVNFHPASPRCCGVEAAAGIVGAVHDSLAVYGVFVAAGAEEIADIARGLGLDGIQLHGEQTDREVERVRTAVGEGVAFIRAVPVRSTAEVAKALADAKGGYRVLLDSAAGGGSGKRFDDSLLTGIDLSAAILAGGLTAANVGEMVERFEPFGVDVAGGVEIEPGIKDHDRIRDFIDHARAHTS